MSSLTAACRACPRTAPERDASSPGSQQFMLGHPSPGVLQGVSWPPPQSPPDPAARVVLLPWKSDPLFLLRTPGWPHGPQSQPVPCTAFMTLQAAAPASEPRLCSPSPVTRLLVLCTELGAPAEALSTPGKGRAASSSSPSGRLFSQRPWSGSVISWSLCPNATF